MAAADALVGTTVGAYKLTGILGEGGMGVVYAAEHLTLGSRTACKVLRREVMDNPDAVARFLQEARLISRVRHRNLIDIFDAGELPDGRLYYIMEYLKGQPLQDRIAAGPRLTFAEILHLLRQIGAGLQAAHGAGIVHRDLKPANIFLVAQPGAPPLVKVVDFGVAKVLNMSGPQAKLTRTGTLVGTPHYMAPEQINGRSVDARADVYALGVILYELCTGQVPFPGDMLGDVVIGHIQKPVPLPSPTQLPSGAPSGLVDVLLKALAKSPDDRYPGVLALIEDLERLLRGEQTTARGRRASQILQLRQQPGEPGTRPRAVRLGAALAAVLALVAGGALWWRLRGGGGAKDGPDMLALRSFALQELQRGLADGDPEVRGLAVEGLRQGGDARQRGLLEARLHDPDPAVQALAARALGALGSRAAVPALLARLDEGGEPAVRAACGEALAQLGEPTGQKALTEALGASRYPQVQLQAALALADAGAAGPDTAAAKLLGERLARARPGDDDVVQILGRRARRGDAEALAQLRQLMPGADVQHPRQLRVAAALAGLGEETARALLAETASRPGPLQVAAAQLLCAQDDATGLSMLRQVLAAPGTSPADRLLSARALGGCGERADARLLYGRLRDGEKGMPLRQTEAGSLLRLTSGDPAVLAELSAGWAALALGDEDWNVRAAAATALGDLDPAQAVPLLQKALRDGRAEVRRSAALALGRSGGAAALKALVGTLADDSVVVRGITTGLADGKTLSVAITDGVTTLYDTATVSGNSWSLASLNLSSLAAGPITVTATHTDDGGNTYADTATINHVRNAVVSIDAISEDTGEVADFITRDDSISIQGTATPGATVNVLIKDASDIVVASFSVPADAGSGGWSTPTTGLPAGTYTLDAEVGGQHALRSMTIVAATAPLLTGSSPADNATGVAVDANLSLSFDRNVRPGSGIVSLYRASDDSLVESYNVSTGLGSLTDSNGAPLGHIAFAGNSLTLNPGTDLDAGTLYYIRVDAGAVIDQAGNAYAGIADSTTVDFRTAGGANQAPVIATSGGSTSFIEGADTASTPVVVDADAPELVPVSSGSEVAPGMSLGQAVSTSKQGAKIHGCTCLMAMIMPR